MICFMWFRQPLSWALCMRWWLWLCFLSYRILDIADLTTDSGFVLGAAVSVTVAAAGHPFLAILAAMAAGACAGFVTAFLQTRTGCSVDPGRNRYKHRSLYGEPDGHGMELQCQSLKAGVPLFTTVQRDRESEADGIS